MTKPKPVPGDEEMRTFFSSFGISPQTTERAVRMRFNPTVRRGRRSGAQRAKKRQARSPSDTRAKDS